MFVLGVSDAQNLALGVFDWQKGKQSGDIPQ